MTSEWSKITLRRGKLISIENTSLNRDTKFRKSVYKRQYKYLEIDETAKTQV